ncbi:fucose-specific lectin [Pluteus cervinus]|uniref:Fucose-specific lectin n=1 Tax=Pluteus cervinus TaxID=181527 RepID=A0ACD3ADZ3_9AGAR|nr:fucose-specific lectin [Pluteus cervinus]
MSLTRTPLAAISFDDSAGKHIRVYYQATNGDIKEAFFDEATNWAPRPQNTVGVGAKLNTGIAAVHYGPGAAIHVFYLGADSKIIERYTDGNGSWVQGQLSGLFKAAPYSRIAAVNQTKQNPTIHIYYQDTTNKLREIIWNGAWVEGTAKLPVALVGTSIAANVDFDPTHANQIWLYYQAADLTLKEQWFSGKNDEWSAGTFKATNVYPPGASLSAALWGSTPTFDRVAAVDENNQVGITACNGPWLPTANLGQETITWSDVVIISVAGGSQPASALRLFYQQAGGNIAELASSDGNSWSFVTSNILA